MISKSIFAMTSLILSCAVALAEESEHFTLPHISVTGSSFAEIKPDIATLRLDVISEKPTAAEAELDNSTSANSVIAALKTLGVDPKDIQTSSLTLAPIIIEERDPKTNRVVKRNLTGYRASNSLNVKIRNVDKAGAIAARIVEMGANHFDGLSFEVSNYVERADEQRVKAVAEAMRRAKLFAQAASMKLGRLLAIDPEADLRESSAADLPMRKFENGPHAAVIPIEPGTVQVGARVTATWELLPE